MIELKDCGVVFSEIHHTYYLGTERLMGITDLIHRVTGLGCYNSLTPYAQNIVIPRAGAKGTAVHQAIEMYDKTGIGNDEFSVRWVEALTREPHEDRFEVRAELQAYIRHMERGKFKPLANEYTVTDGKRWASKIDNVWVRSRKEKKQEIEEVWLVDTKTNNIKYYPGGKDGLKGYLSWQLSIYAYLFEAMNPDIKVAGLACNWLREDNSEFWEIDRLDDALIANILNTEWEEKDGEVLYFHMEDGERKYYDFGVIPADAEGQKRRMKEYDSMPEQLQELAARYKDLVGQKEAIEKQMEECRGAIIDIMKSKNASVINGIETRMEYVPAATYQRFDTKLFKKENEYLYKRYLKDINQKETVRIVSQKY